MLVVIGGVVLFFVGGGSSLAALWLFMSRDVSLLLLVTQWQLIVIGNLFVITLAVGPQHDPDDFAALSGSGRSGRGCGMVWTCLDDFSAVGVAATAWPG